MAHCFAPTHDNAHLDPTRSLFKIVWSCATTLFACTYVAIHPNISVNESDGVVLVRRIGLMIAMGLVPELVLLWALKQRLIASSMRLKHGGSDKKWTQTHGFFLIMGGFSYYDRHQEKKALDYPTLLDMHHPEGGQSEIEWPTVVTAPEIKDRSKADFLTKTIVVIQTLWFCIQFIARLILHLNVTELEVATFAYAILNIIVYGLWWNKPFDVRSQILLRGIHDVAFPHPTNPGPLSSSVSTVAQKSSQELTTAEYLRRCWKDMWKSMPNKGSVAVIDVIMWPYSFFCDVLMRPICMSMTTYNGPIPDIDLDTIETSNLGRWNKMELWIIRRFWKGKNNDSDEDRFSLVPFSLLIAIIFGGIHLIGWEFQFPSTVEMWLWRASSLALVAPAVLIMAVRIPGGAYLCGLLPTGISDVFVVLSMIWLVIIPITYAIGRVIILFLPLISLRRLPCGAYEDVNWIGIFFPHF